MERPIFFSSTVTADVQMRAEKTNLMRCTVYAGWLFGWQALQES